MDRPTSKGSRAGTPKPGTSRRPGTQSLNAQSQSGRPGTVTRPTASRRGGGGGVAQSTGYGTEDRPVTQQGLKGVKASLQGPGRQVADTSFYKAELQRKIKELQDVIGSMQQEMEQLNESSRQQRAQEQQMEKVTKTVRENQRKLADLNIMLDKGKQSTSIDELSQHTEELKSKNENAQKQLDDLVESRIEAEKFVKQYEESISERQQDVQERLEGLDQNLREQYEHLQSENTQLAQDINRQENERDNLRQEADNLERDLTHDNFKQRALDLIQKIKAAKQKRTRLQAEAKEAMSPEEEREQLKRKVRDDNEEIQRVDQELQRVSQEVRKAERGQKVAATSSSRSPSDGEQDARYEQLREKEPQFREFIDNFDENYKQMTEEKEGKKQDIVELLNRISRTLQERSNLPHPARYEQLKDELEYKHFQMENAETTKEKLQHEREYCQEKLKQIENFDEKVDTELESIRQRMEQMQNDMEKFKKLDELRDKSEQLRKDLETDEKRLGRRAEVTKAVIQEQTRVHEDKKRELESDDNYNEIKKSERRLASVWEDMHKTRLDLAEKEQEANFDSYLADVNKLVSEVNEQNKSTFTA